MAEQFGWTVYIVMAGFAFSCLVRNLWVFEANLSFLSWVALVGLSSKTQSQTLPLPFLSVFVLATTGKAECQISSDGEPRKRVYFLWQLLRQN